MCIHFLMKIYQTNYCFIRNNTMVCFDGRQTQSIHNAMTMPLLAAVFIFFPAYPQAYLGIWICVVMRICGLPLYALIFFLKTNQMLLLSLGHQLQFFFWFKFQFCNVEWTHQSQDHLEHPHFALSIKYDYRLC